MRVRVKQLENLCLVGETESGHALVMDGPPDLGGNNLSARPMEMVLLGLGGCTAVDVLEILRKSRQAVSNCEVVIDAERADAVPMVFTKIHLHYIITGHALKENSVKRAVDLSSDKYCSVSQMLNKTAEMSWDYEIKEA